MHWGRMIFDGDFRIYKTIYIFMQMIDLTAAGVCWTSSDTRTKACREAFNLNMTREECCSISHVPAVSWSPEDYISRSRLFLTNYLRVGVIRCQRCHNNCSSVQCPEGLVCRMKKGFPECICKPRCSKSMKELGPFCGTDGRKYKNYCSLLRQNCIYHQEADISYFGKCRKSCKKVECLPGNHCLQDQNGIPHCVSCDTNCPYKIPDNISSYICASDGKTYKNTCDLRAAICRKGRSIKIAYQGPCIENSSCSTIQCQSQKTCLTDVKTRTPTCSDCTKICLSTIHIPVCGTDGRTYSSYCHMQTVSCRRGILIRARRAGACKGSSNSLKSRKKGRRIKSKKAFRDRKEQTEGRRIKSNDTETRNRKKIRAGRDHLSKKDEGKTEIRNFHRITRNKSILKSADA